MSNWRLVALSGVRYLSSSTKSPRVVSSSHPTGESRERIS